ncbi:MAG: tetratricopeptide repeat protein, partial [Thermoanaerobaculia bacterium]
ALAASPAGSAEALAKLRALGYLSPSESSVDLGGAAGTRTGASYNNEALILAGAGRTDEAIAAYERALALEPDLASANWNLSQLLFRLGRDFERSDELLLQALESGLADGVEQVIGRAEAYRDDERGGRVGPLIDTAVAARPKEPQLRLFRGRDLLAAERCVDAAADFTRAAELAPDDPLAPASLGLAQLCLGDEAAARRAFLRSLELDPDQPELRQFLEH